MFSAIKSFQSNISSNYTLAAQPTSTAGPWRIFDAKRKSNGKAASVFVFERKSLEPTNNGLGGRGNSTSVKAAQHEVLERLKKEASSLARLRHPSILELAEPVEETRNGGLMFATEPVTASLSGLLADKDEQEGSGRGSRYMLEESDGTRRRRELEIDELEIQKGLLQIAKGLEFMHESAGLVHANLTPGSIVVNAKGDWKITGLSFAGPASDSDKPTSISPISLSEVLNHDPRLPASVQLDLDYTSPDFVLDSNLVSSSDMFSLGLLIVALYNNPHQSPIETHGSLSSYKRIFASSSTVPTRANNFLCKGKMPPNLASELLPRLITRRPAQRLSAKDFQQAQYFDNILVSTLRFLESFPEKTPNEKAQFMKGLPRIMPQFPTSVLEKKLLPALLEETKDRELLAPVLQDVFAIVEALPASKRAFVQIVIPKLREVFIDMAVSGKNAPRDTSKEAGLMVILENMGLVADWTTGGEFRDDILPIVAIGLASPTHAIIDASLSTLPHITPKLDYTTIKNELFPVIAGVFAHTNSLAIKIQGLEAFYTLCGGTDEPDPVVGDGLDGTVTRHGENRQTSSAVLDKFTIQEKIVPMLKGIKTKEPAVMMSALKVFRQIGKVVDTDFLAMEVLPILWSFSLGPLLDLTQFQAFMTLIKALSGRIEREQSQKLRELSSNTATPSLRTGRAVGKVDALTPASANGDVDFETLVSGRTAANGSNDMIDDWGTPAVKPVISQTVSHSSPAFSRSTTAQSTATAAASSLRAPSVASRSVTPDQSMNSFAALTPSSRFDQPLQPMAPSSTNMSSLPVRPMQQSTNQASTIDWSAASRSGNAWASAVPTQSMQTPSFAIAPPPASPPARNPMSGSMSATFKPPPGYASGQTLNGMTAPTQQSKQGLDKYQSLI
ncbi:hypothetical protein MBLNU457_5273t1 [Dothideomycetes sp. NU457]